MNEVATQDNVIKTSSEKLEGSDKATKDTRGRQYCLHEATTMAENTQTGVGTEVIFAYK